MQALPPFPDEGGKWKKGMRVASNWVRFRKIAKMAAKMSIL
jgi:hypothetical protein